MKHTLIIFIGILALGPQIAFGAVKVTKAAPVAKQTQSTTDSVGSLVPTVMNLVGAVKTISAKTRDLSAECIPSTAEVNFVNNMVKEWAKTGASTADEAFTALRLQKCKTGDTYAGTVELAGGQDDEIICCDYFSGTDSTGNVWDGFPKASVATYCSDGSIGVGCNSNKKKTVSNIYNVFNLIDFTELDYNKSELTMAKNLVAKIEKCSDAKLSARKRAIWNEFLMDTIGTLGAPTNTGTIMQSVSQVSSGGIAGGLQSLGGITQFLNK